MKYKKEYGYLILVVFIAGVGLAVDMITLSVPVELRTNNVLDETGQIRATLAVSYPAWLKLLNLLTNFLYGLAAAVFITVFVANKLQKTQQKAQEKELKKIRSKINVDIFDTLFKTIIPEEIFRIIKSEIIESKVVRKRAKWIYDFTVNSSGRIDCRMTTRYELHNLSQSKVLNPVELDLDPLGGDEYQIIEAECEDMNGKVLVYYDSQSNANSKNVDVSTIKRRTKVKYTVEIPKESYVIYKTVFTRTYSDKIVDSQATKVPVIGADIIVNFPKNYEFDIAPTMSTKPKLICESDIQKIYRIDGGVLPWQGFMYYLIKK